MSFKITIGNTVEEPKLKNCYMINLSYMHGDADLYTNGEMGPFNPNTDMDQLQEALTVCSKIKELDPDDAEIVDGFDVWFKSNEQNPFSVRIDTDATCDNEFNCSLDDFNLVYYDNIGKVHICYIEEENK